MLTLSPGLSWIIRGAASIAGAGGSLALGDCAAFTEREQTDQISNQSPEFRMTERLDTPKPPDKTSKRTRGRADRETYSTISIWRESIDSTGQFHILLANSIYWRETAHSGRLPRARAPAWSGLIGRMLLCPRSDGFYRQAAWGGPRTATRRP